MKKYGLPKIILSTLLAAAFCLTGFSQAHGRIQENSSQEKEKREQIITEEVVVTAEAPRERSVATVNTLQKTQIENMAPLDLSEAIRYVPGVTVTSGDKSTYTLKLRGMDAKRIALLLDGIPVYEPYYSSFDLKTISAGNIQTLKLTKGPSSVLYGPNTLGGIVNVVTRRPGARPSLSMTASYGEQNTRQVGVNTAFRLDRFSFVGGLQYQDSDGFYYPGRENGKRINRTNSEYQRGNVNAKVYYHPNDRTELMFNAGMYLSNYSMPPEIDAYRPRYWRFKNWDRATYNAGGTTALGDHSTLKFRIFLVQLDNTLVMYRDAEMTQKRFESTFDNAVYGAYTLADIQTHPFNRLKFSLNYKGDKARLQDDVGEPWTEFDQGTFSAGAEDHISLNDNWKLVGGVSFDHLNKFIGETTSKINPMAGIKFSPGDDLDMHLSFSKKSKFPSMRSMYSESSGNPDLLSESGTIWELGFHYTRGFLASGSVFLTRFKDMIDSVVIPQYDFRRLYYNIGEAHIHGFEIQLQKSWDTITGVVNYTYLDHRNETDDRPLDALPSHNLNFNAQIYPVSALRIGLMGLYGSQSWWFDYNIGEMLEIPSYFSLDGIISYRFDPVEVFVKVTNVFNDYIYTEPGFPWRGRFIQLGIRTDLLQ
ncbi:MAG: TonB-dependent receptor [Candidatus Aminicenantes bacterium]